MSKKPRLGRPPLRDAERRKHIMSIRVRPKLHALLQEAADKAGRTLSQEVEFRIETTFMREVEIAKVAGVALEGLDILSKKFDEMDKVLDVFKANAKRRGEELERLGAQKGWEKPK
jgi:hypothetical protein